MAYASCPGTVAGRAASARPARGIDSSVTTDGIPAAGSTKRAASSAALPPGGHDGPRPRPRHDLGDARRRVRGVERQEGGARLQGADHHLEQREAALRERHPVVDADAFVRKRARDRARAAVELRVGPRLGTASRDDAIGVRLRVPLEALHVPLPRRRGDPRRGCGRGLRRGTAHRQIADLGRVRARVPQGHDGGLELAEQHLHLGHLEEIAVVREVEAEGPARVHDHRERVVRVRAVARAPAPHHHARARDGVVDGGVLQLAEAAKKGVPSKRVACRISVRGRYS